MISRRAALRGIALTTTAGLAGCTGDGGQQQGDGSESDIQAAGDDLDKALDEFQSEADRFDSIESGEGVDVETSVIESHLEAASQDLDAAEQDASAAQQDRIEALRSIISILQSLTTAIDVIAEGFTATQTGRSYISSERYEDAKQRFTTAQTRFESARGSITEAQSSVDRIEQANIEDTGPDIAEMRSGITKLKEINELMIGLSDGFADLSSGLQDYQVAADRAESERYTAGAAAAADARAHFSSAVSTLRELESTAPSSFQPDIVDTTCRAEALRDAADHYNEGCEAAADGRYDTARSEFRASEDALESC